MTSISEGFESRQQMAARKDQVHYAEDYYSLDTQPLRSR